MVATFTLDSKNIFKGIKNESLLSFARIMTVVLIVPAILIASKGYSVLYLFFVADLVCTGVFFPLFFGLFNKDLTEKTALLSAILGVISGVPFFIANKLLIAFALPVVTSSIVCIVGTMFSKQADTMNANEI